MAITMAWHPEVEKVVKSELARQKRLFRSHDEAGREHQMEPTARKIEGLENALKTRTLDDFAKLALRERLQQIDEFGLRAHKRLDEKTGNPITRSIGMGKIFGRMLKKRRLK